MAKIFKSNNTDKFWDGSERSYSSIDVSPNKFNAGVNIPIVKYLNLNANVNYRSQVSKFFTIDPTTKLYVDNSKDQVGDYWLCNLSLRCTDLIPHVELNASCANVFNTQYYAQEADPTMRMF